MKKKINLILIVSWNAVELKISTSTNDVQQNKKIQFYRFEHYSSKRTHYIKSHYITF